MLGRLAGLASGARVFAGCAMIAAGILMIGLLPMDRSLTAVSETLDLARRAFTIVRQNLIWAFAYNVVGITLAMAGVLNPIMAAAAMMLSSFSVIGSSQRLKDSCAAGWQIGSSDGDCAPPPSHTTGHAVFRIRRLNPAALLRGKH
jgi:hypothetical protein